MEILTVKQKIELLKIEKAFNEVSDYQESGFETISKYSDESITNLKKWYSENSINEKFFNAKERAEKTIKHI